jgi:RimJ/RimL family protein N-acetyltransferase
MARFKNFDTNDVQVFSKKDGELTVRTMAWSDINTFSDLRNKNKDHVSKWEIVYLGNPATTSIDFGIWLGDTPIGKVTLWNVDKIQGSSKVSYWIDQDHCGNGYMTKALNDVVEYAFANLNIKEISAPVQLDNEISISLLEKLQFTKLGRSVYETLDGTLVTHYVYVRNLNANL